MTDQANTPVSAESHPIETECPSCGHRFLYKIKHLAEKTGHAIENAAIDAGGAIGNTIGDAKFGGS